MCLQAACSRTEAEPPPPDPDAIGVALYKAGELFKQREDIDALKACVAQLEKLRSARHRNFEVEWAYAKYSYFLGKRLGEGDAGTSAFEKGREAGAIASRIEVDRPEGHFWYAANLGELSRRSPITVGLHSLDDIKESMQRVIEIDPGYEAASAFDALGQVELATRFKGGSAEKAVEYLERGLELGKNNPNIRLHLAEAFLALDRDAEAREKLHELLEMKPDPDYLPEHREAVEKGRELLRKRF